MYIVTERITGLYGSHGLPWWSVVKNPPVKAGDVGLIPGLGRSPGEGNANPLQWTEEPCGLQFMG